FPYSSGVHFGEGDSNRTRDFVFSVHSLSSQKPSLRRIENTAGNSEKAFARALSDISTKTETNNEAVVCQISSRDLIAIGVKAPSSSIKKEPLYMMVDPSQSFNVKPTLNSIKSMKPICLRLERGEGMYVAKFVRSGDDAYEFSCNFRLISPST
ncbi:hypothetical protein MHBO_005205, partial [Bonamia ostreae]